jgi:ATP-dependent Clp protease adaptor protein ClpS
MIHRGLGHCGLETARSAREMFSKRMCALAENAAAAVIDEVEEAPAPTRKRQPSKPKRQPRYHVVLWDDSDHSYEYVVRMMKELFGQPPEKGYEIAVQVDQFGRAICLTTTKEHAELKRDQIHAYGKDSLIARCKGSMSASIEPET